MKKEIFKLNDTLFLGTEKVKLIDIGNSESRHFLLDSDSELSFWFPKSIEKLLSFTPYHFEGDYLVGFTQEKPWKPKQGEPVWVWDEGDKSKYIGIYVCLTDDLHKVQTSKPNKLGQPSNFESFEFVEPF